MRQAFTIAACAAFTIAMAAPAAAQFNRWIPAGRPGYDDQYRSSYYDARRTAYDYGFREGLKDGGKAARTRRVFDLQREKDFRNGDKGYRREYGDKGRYREAFRAGFAGGYRQAYERLAYHGRVAPRDQHRSPRGSYPGAYGGAYNIAYQNGINDGYEKGLDDVRHNRAPDARRQKWYRSGDRHYDGDYGSKDAYKQRYRAGFQDGYARAYGTGRW